MRLGSNIARLDPRNLLKFLIAFNLFFALYQLYSFHFNSKPTSCILNITTSPSGKNDHSFKQQLQQMLTSIISDEYDQSINIDPNHLLNAQNNDDNGNTIHLQDGTESIAELASQLLDSPTVSQQFPVNRKPRTIWWTPEQRNSYIVIRNYVLPEIKETSANNNESVTLTTQGTFEFLNHVENLCKRWDGPISVAVYAPGDDIPISLGLIYFLRSCGHECVLKNVSWHFIYDINHGPDMDKVPFPEDYLNLTEFNCLQTYEDFYKKSQSLYRSVNKLPYPINVARNVARLNAKTKYLLASDIELYPSLNVVSMFKEYLERERANQVPLVSRNVPHVYVLPIFEVKANLTPPSTKNELIRMVKKGDAIFFHKWVCDTCQNFPDRNLWINELPGNDSLNIFRSTKRTRNRNSWEPLYIGTNAEPLYEEKLTWEGKRDKMSQMFEMCLLNYDILILDNAFLVHASGIKHIDEQDQKKRLPFIVRNNRVYDTVIGKLVKQYGNKEKRC